MTGRKPALWPALAFWLPVAAAAVLCAVGRTSVAFLAAGGAFAVLAAMVVHAVRITPKGKQ